MASGTPANHPFGMMRPRHGVLDDVALTPDEGLSMTKPTFFYAGVYEQGELAAIDQAERGG